MGGWVIEEDDIKEVVGRAFKNLLTVYGDWSPSDFYLGFERIDLEEATKLESPFTKGKIFKGLSGFGGERVYGLDGFSLVLW